MQYWELPSQLQHHASPRGRGGASPGVVGGDFHDIDVPGRAAGGGRPPPSADENSPRRRGGGREDDGVDGGDVDDGDDDDGDNGEGGGASSYSPVVELVDAPSRRSRGSDGRSSTAAEAAPLSSPPPPVVVDRDGRRRRIGAIIWASCVTIVWAAVVLPSSLRRRESATASPAHVSIQQQPADPDPPSRRPPATTTTTTTTTTVLAFACEDDPYYNFNGHRDCEMYVGSGSDVGPVVQSFRCDRPTGHVHAIGGGDMLVRDFCRLSCDACDEDPSFGAGEGVGHGGGGGGSEPGGPTPPPDDRGVGPSAIGPDENGDGGDGGGGGVGPDDDAAIADGKGSAGAEQVAATNGTDGDGGTTTTTTRYAPGVDYPRPYEDGIPAEYDRGGAGDGGAFFPPGFVWGVGTSAHQIEGGSDERGTSVWDAFADAPNPGMADAACDDGRSSCDGASVSCDHYHRYREDVAAMASLGLRSYRFSISWPRLLATDGTVGGGVSEDGRRFYDDLLDELVRVGIEPYVTLYHWDLPQSFHDGTSGENGWLDESIVGHFVRYSELCFDLFGDRVKKWITFNEPWVFGMLGYGAGTKAPGVPYTWQPVDLPGNPGVANADGSGNYPYVVGHNVLRAHVSVVASYREKFKGDDARGLIGISLNCDWGEPASRSPDDIAAAERYVEWQLGWFADIIYLGDYPMSMRRKLGDRLPVFAESERQMFLNNKPDFFGLNHYTTNMIVDAPSPPGYDDDPALWSYFGDREVSESYLPEVCAGCGPLRAASVWHKAAPWGTRKLLSWIANRYGGPPVLITENGWSSRGSMEEEINDIQRVLFHANTTSEVLKAINEDGVDVRGYFAWSMMDNYEWECGYSERFGITYVDFDTLERKPKNSAEWLRRTIASNSLVDVSDLIAM
jgi:beta-glucosidase